MLTEIRGLTNEEEEARESALALASRLVGKSTPLSANDVQALYQVLIDHHDELEEGLIALGIAFGELIVAKAGYEWVRITDEWGSENALSPHGWDASCHPISRIQKRIARVDTVDIGELVEDTIYAVQNLIDEGKARPRAATLSK